MTAKRTTKSGNTGKGSSSSTRNNSKSRSSSSRDYPNPTKGSASYNNDDREYESYTSGDSKGGSNSSGQDTSRDTPSKEAPNRGDNYRSSTYSKGDSNREDNYSSNPSSKGNSSSYDDDRRSASKGDSSYTDDDYSNDFSSKGNNDYNDNYNYEENNDAESNKGGNSYNDDYRDDNSNASSTSKTDGSYSNDDSNASDSGYRSKSEEPINDPPYDDNNENVVAKQPQTDPTRSTSKGDGDADMTFTEEEVYGSEENTRETTSSSSIERVWVWAGGAIPRTAISNDSASFWTNRVALGMTDYVIALNDHGFSNGLGIKPNYVNRGERSNRWQPISEILRICDSHGIAPHLMIFLKPIPEMIRDAANVLQEIVADSPVTPRSIQLDLEAWWTRRSESQRREGDRAIQQYFKDEWRVSRPELGIGITCIGGVPPAVQGAISKVDFAIPQMYASERNYGRPIRENSVNSHFSRAAEALGNGGKVIVGQTAYSRYVNPAIMKEMLTVLLRINHPSAGGVREVAYWSDTHLRNSRENREFFQRLTRLVRDNGLNLNNIEQL